MTLVLVVDDSPQIRATLRLNLRARDYEVVLAPDGGGALAGAADWHPDLVILDLGLPDLDGIDVIRGLRGRSRVPIIVLSGRAGADDKIEALDAGADDYVTKPFGVDELLARIRAVTRRAPVSGAPSVVGVGNHSIDLVGRIVYGPGGARVHLTPTEWRLLEILVRHPGELLSQPRLLAEVWSPSHLGAADRLRVHMASLRRKLENDPSRPRHLITQAGTGYRFDP